MLFFILSFIKSFLTNICNVFRTAINVNLSCYIKNTHNIMHILILKHVGGVNYLSLTIVEFLQRSSETKRHDRFITTFLNKDVIY